MFSSISRLVAFSLLSSAAARYFPPAQEGITLLESKFHDNVTISYKETTICETTPGVKSYSGYIHLPSDASEARPYNINIFFWFFEARKDPSNAPLTLWLQGGPGVPSTTAALGENGPCLVNEDSKTTTLNPWSWNNEVNMLYIDQPVQVGFSYDALVNGTINQLSSPVNVTVEDFSRSGVPAENNTFVVGTFPSQNPNTTADTTSDAALAIWHFMQTFTQEFPEYKSKDNKISIWTESYGGHYGPSFAELFESQNDLIASGELPAPATPLYLDTLGIINGCVDILTQILAYPQMAYNNTYGLKLINETAFQSAVNSFPACQNVTLECRLLAAAEDPQAVGNNTVVNAACAKAFGYCFETMWSAYAYSGRNVFDIAQSTISSFPPPWAAGYLNSAEVQKSLGVTLNFTGEALTSNLGFTATGDFVRGGNLENIGDLLNRGVRVTLVYGDRDYQCNWIGGEEVSLAINSTYTDGFHAAGYANLKTNDTYVGGVVRQYGNLSFTRVFEAGHEVPYYQPETAYRIFQRAIANTDIATGQTHLGGPSEYSTSGPDDIAQIKNAVPMIPPSVCYMWNVAGTCTKEQMMMLANGTAIMQDYIFVGYSVANGSEIFLNGTETPNQAGAASTTTTGPGVIASSIAPDAGMRRGAAWTIAAAMATATVALLAL